MVINSKEYNVRPITWKERRNLHARHAQIYLNSDFNEQGVKTLKIDWDKYYEVIEIALGIAFDNPEKELDGLTDAEIDAVGQSIINEYLNPSKKKNGS